MLFTIVTLNIILTSQLCKSQHCATKNSVPCIFPFEYQNKSLNACQPRRNRPERKWCSIKVDREGRHIEGKPGVTWGICSSECPLEGDTECEETSQCINKDNCPEYQQFKKLSKKDPNYQKEKAKWIKSVCNRKEKRLCCSKQTTTIITPPTPTITISPPSSTPTINKPSQCNEEQEYPGKYLPRLGQCGKKCSLARIFGGEDAKLGEFPWAALLGYTIRKKVQVYPSQEWVIKKRKAFKCGGTLINTRYVITAAHCHKNKSKISSVTLGELNANTDPDCPENYKNESECLPEKQVIEVESVIIHEGYNNDKNNGEITNDIALIRLKEHAVLNRAVQPICLPLNEEAAAEEIGAVNMEEGIVNRASTIIGWGASKNWQSVDQDCGVPECILQKVDIPIISNINCQEKLSELTEDINKNITIRSSHICALEENSRKDSCKGDSGGGMFVSKNLDDKTDDTYFQVGIVSFGLSKCGIGYPGVYTRITEFISWIIENIQD